MVEVATKEELEALKSRIRDLLGDGGKVLDDINKRLDDIDKFKKIIEVRLDEMEKSTMKRLDDRVNAFVELKEHIDNASASIHNRVDDIEEKMSKSIITRIKEAFASVPE